MSLLRKLLVGVLSLAAVVGIFILYRMGSKPPQIDVEPRVGSADSNFPGFKGTGGRIGDNTEVALLSGPTYISRDPNTKEIDREFGFADLIRAVGDVWEVDKPWMKIYRKNLEIHIRADQGTTELETVVGRSTPKDATFTGNVVIRIFPDGAAAGNESTIYLDTLMFLSDKSQFSTAGPVKFASEEANMLGRGLEFVYSESTDRLEYLRITHLESLHIKSTESALSGKAEPRDVSEKASEKGTGPKIAKPTAASKVPATADSQKAKTAPAPPAGAAVARTGDEYYKCILSKNVVIDTPDQIVFAELEVLITDILWSKQPIDQNDQTPAAVAKAAPKAPGKVAAKQPQAPAAAAKQSQAAASEPNDLGEKKIDIVVTCDNGVLLVPMNSRRGLEDFRSSNVRRADAKTPPDREPDAAQGPAEFHTQTIDYSALTGYALARGSSELLFYTGDLTGADANKTSIPVKVTSQKSVTFSKSLNQAVFEGDCLCTMPQQGLTRERDVVFSGSKLTVNLPADMSRGSSVSPEIIAAGPVELTFYVEDSNAPDPNVPPVPVIITAQDQATFLPDSNEVIFDGNCVCTMVREDLAAEQNFTLRSSQLIANLPTSGPNEPSKLPDVLALGPVELRFYADTSSAADPNADPVPAKVTATKQARFMPSANQIRFEGDCKATTLREDPNFVEERILSSQYIVVDLPAEGNEASSASPAGIKHLRAYGGVVRLATKKTAGGKQLSGIELICRQFDHDADQDIFIATGPGEIRLDASQAAEPNAPSGTFSLNKPCWAFVQNFDTLKYFPKENKIIADAGANAALVVKYIPIENGEYGDLNVVTADRVVCNLIETATGGSELATLTASGGVTYQSPKNQFIGGKFFYDHAKGLITVVGSESFPCQYNGALTDQIEYNLNTGRIKADLIGPGALQLK